MYKLLITCKMVNKTGLVALGAIFIIIVSAIAVAGILIYKFGPYHYQLRSLKDSEKCYLGFVIEIGKNKIVKDDNLKLEPVENNDYNFKLEEGDTGYKIKVVNDNCYLSKGQSYDAKCFDLFKVKKDNKDIIEFKLKNKNNIYYLESSNVKTSHTITNSEKGCNNKSYVYTLVSVKGKKLGLAAVNKDDIGKSEKIRPFVVPKNSGFFRYMYEYIRK